jgi:homoserine kinase
MKVTVKVPATSANLGPGFDALGLALDWRNEATFTPAGNFSVTIKGEGAGTLPETQDNLIIRAAQRLAERAGRSLPAFHLSCINRIPLGSGLGSSAAAILTGLLGAEALLGNPFSNADILNLATEIEGHPDNVAPALLGGLVVSIINEGKVLARKLTVGADFAVSHRRTVGVRGTNGMSAQGGRTPPLHITVVLPNFNFPTQQARAALPEQVPMQDAVQGISRAVLVTEAFRAGDLDLLGQAMQDTLHQPYRLPLIPGGREAMDAAKRAGAAAVALSGAGPSLIAFAAEREDGIGEAMKRVFESFGLSARVFELGVGEEGAKVESRE